MRRTVHAQTILLVAVAAVLALGLSACGGGAGHGSAAVAGNSSAARFQNDKDLAKLTIDGDLSGIYRQSNTVISNGGDTLPLEQATQQLVDDLKDAGNLVTDQQRRASIDEALRAIEGYCDRCETILRDARP